MPPPNPGKNYLHKENTEFPVECFEKENRNTYKVGDEISKNVAFWLKKKGGGLFKNYGSGKEIIVHY